MIYVDENIYNVKYRRERFKKGLWVDNDGQTFRRRRRRTSGRVLRMERRRTGYLLNFEKIKKNKKNNVR